MALRLCSARLAAVMVAAAVRRLQLPRSWTRRALDLKPKKANEMLNSADSGSIFIQRGDGKHPGTQTVNRGMITVRGPPGSRTTHLSTGSGMTHLTVRSVESFAKVLLAKGSGTRYPKIIAPLDP